MYLVQYYVHPKWRTYSRHRKRERALDVKAKLEGFYVLRSHPVLGPSVRVVDEAARDA